MPKIKTRPIINTLVWSLFLTLLLGVLQIIFLSGSNFLGVSSTVAFEILRFYPLTAVLEVIKIHSFIFCIIFTVQSILVATIKQRKTRLLLIAIASFGYLLLLAASFLRYPAIFQDLVSPNMQRLLFKASYFLNPRIIEALAYLCFAVFIARAFWQLGRKKYPFIVIFLGLLLCLLLPWPKFNGRGSKDLKKPNIIFIGIDSFRSDRLQKDIVPTLSKLKNSQDVVSFNDHIIGIPRTFPSWMEIVTGKYSAETGIRHMFPGLALQRQFYPSLISEAKKAGYSTAVISDFAGDIFPRFHTGFDTVNAPESNIPTITKMTIDQSFPLFLPVTSSQILNRFFLALKENPCFSDPEKLIDEAQKFVASTDEPFFLSVFFSSAHFPYAAPWPWYSKYSDPNYAGPYFFKKDPDLQFHKTGQSDVNQIRSLYNGALSGIDQALARFFNKLTDEQWANTILVVTADHGEDLFEFDRIQGHGDHLRGENVLRVPLLIKIPKQFELKRQNIDFTTRMIDLAPTLANLLGAKLNSATGMDLSPWFFDSSKANPDLAAYSETEIWFTNTGETFYQKERLDYPNISALLSLDPGSTGAIVLNPNYERVTIAGRHRSLSKGDYKLIYTPTSSGAFFKLYNRKTDPMNSSDIAEQEPKLFSEMKKLLVNHVRELESNTQIIDSYMVPF